jgi:hypothetical protein
VSRSLEDRRKDDAFYRKCKILVTVTTPFLYIKPIIANDVQFIRYPLQEELKLVRKNRQRCYGTMIQSSYLGGQLWQNDWHMYEKPGIRVEVWGEIQLNVFTSARVGEYIELTCSTGSSRGLYL